MSDLGNFPEHHEHAHGFNVRRSLSWDMIALPLFMRPMRCFVGAARFGRYFCAGLLRS